MDNFKVEVTSTNRHIVMFRHTPIGEIAQDTDGEYVLFPKPQREGFWRLWLLEAIAAELKRLNYGQEKTE